MYSITQCVCVMLLYLIVLYTELINDVIIYIIMKLSCTVVTMELLWAVDYVTIEIGTTTVTHVLAAEPQWDIDSHKHTEVSPSYDRVQDLMAVVNMEIVNMERRNQTVWATRLRYLEEWYIELQYTLCVC